MKFSEKQIEFMKKIGISINSFEDITDEEFIMIEEKVSDYLQTKGFDESYKPNDDGLMCESILDLL